MTIMMKLPFGRTFAVESVPQAIPVLGLGLDFQLKTKHCLTLAKRTLCTAKNELRLIARKSSLLRGASGRHGDVDDASCLVAWEICAGPVVLHERAVPVLKTQSLLDPNCNPRRPWVRVLVVAGSALVSGFVGCPDLNGGETPREKTVSFRNEVVPLLTKLGCNQGACHGSQHGKGGFKLSLLGFEPEADYTAIVKSAEERRVTPFAPEESLLLLKPTLSVAHGGGKRMEADSPLIGCSSSGCWQGAPGPRDDDPRVVGLKVYPDARLMEPGQEQQLAVLATFSDGSKRDVTVDARFDTLNEGVATVRPAGLARTVGKGEANIMVRYQGRAAMARLTVPFAREKPFEFPDRRTSSTSRPPPSGASWGSFRRRSAPTPSSCAARCST